MKTCGILGEYNYTNYINEKSEGINSNEDKKVKKKENFTNSKNTTFFFEDNFITKRK